MASAQKVLITQEVHANLSSGLNELGYSCDERFAITNEEVIKIIGDYSGIVVSTRIKVDRSMIENGKKLAFIARAGSGMENIDMEAAAAKGVVCINSPEGNANAVGEHAVALLLALFHNLAGSITETRRGEWLVEKNRTHELEGRTLGIIGYGNTGKSFAGKLQPFHMNVIAYDKYLNHYGDACASQVTMEEIFSQSEIISMHVPLTDETHGLVSSSYLQRFSNPVHLINTCRGKVVNHSHLLEAIREGRVISAALDVFENEDFKSQSDGERNVFRSLVETQRVIFTPHIAGKSFESKKKIAEVLVKKIGAWQHNVKRLSKQDDIG